MDPRNSRAHDLSRRDVLKQSAAGRACAAGLGADRAAAAKSGSRAAAGDVPRVIIVGCDGMDPRLSLAMMNAGELPHLDRLRRQGGFRPLRTSIPPQSPVAWASFINGAGPGSHGIFDFIHRHPEDQCTPFFSAAETLPAQGSWQIGEHQRATADLADQPQTGGHRAAQAGRAVLGLPGRARHSFHLLRPALRLSGQSLPSTATTTVACRGWARPTCWAPTAPISTLPRTARRRPATKPAASARACRSMTETAKACLVGPQNASLKDPRPARIELLVHRDRKADAAVIELPDRKVLLRAGQWSPWIKLDFRLSAPLDLPDSRVERDLPFLSAGGGAEFPPVRQSRSTSTLPIRRCGSPSRTAFVQEISGELGLFATTGFQEDHKALSNGVFNDEQFIAQAQDVLEERLRLLDYAMAHYDDGVLFFYFSSTDLQAHMLWWDSDKKHPTKSAAQVQQGFGHVRRLYQKLDAVVGEILARYDGRATVLVMSDHGFANFGRQFNLNSWLRDQGYLGPRDCTSIMADVDWTQTRAYGLGINGLYLNLRERERDGIVDPGRQGGPAGRAGDRGWRPCATTTAAA